MINKVIIQIIFLKDKKKMHLKDAIKFIFQDLKRQKSIANENK